MTHGLTIAFHGQNAANFRAGFERLIEPGHTVLDLSDDLSGPGEREAYARADVIVGIRLDDTLPAPAAARLFHAPAAGTDAIDTRRLPATTALCNCHGHEQAIAEYVFAALLQRHVPLAAADADLRQDRWTWWAGRPGALRSELGGQTLGLLGYGHIAQALAPRARAFGMQVHAANRSPVRDPQVHQAWSLTELVPFLAGLDVLVVTLPLTPQTQGLVDADLLSALPRGAWVINVGRGPVIDEAALHGALSSGHLGGAVLDTWYQYPNAERPTCAPSRLDFRTLPNVTMTPHMSGWTEGTVRRRQQTIADNIARLVRGHPLDHVVRAATPA